MKKYLYIANGKKFLVAENRVSDFLSKYPNAALATAEAPQVKKKNSSSRSKYQTLVQILVPHQNHNHLPQSRNQYHYLRIRNRQPGMIYTTL